MKMQSKPVDANDVITVELPRDGAKRARVVADLVCKIPFVARRISDLEQQIEQYAEQSQKEIDSLRRSDDLTGLPNRREFLAQVSQLLDGHAKALNDGLVDDVTGLVNGAAVLYLNLDDFRKVNDTMGHKAGDMLLKRVAGRLELCIAKYRQGDRTDVTQPSERVRCLGRLGGDEFAILVENLSDPMDAAQIAETVLLALQRPIVIEEHEMVTSASIGISCFPQNAHNVESLIACADTAMFDAKRREKNCYLFFGDNMTLGTQERLGIERDLRIAVETEGFELNYQPQFDTQTQALVGVEALLRWHHPIRGSVPPDKFIGIAEDMGLIGVLGEWIIDEACRQWAAWNLADIAPLRIAVNVSQKQFKLSYLPDVVANALDKHNIPAEVFEVEITESCMMEAASDVVQALNVIRDSGVRIAMDDFGTGYSSLSSLTSLPIDTLKIDRSFVTGVEQGKTNEKVVSAIVSLAHNLKLEIVAEGVENESDYLYLLGKGCEICQGYLFSRPLTALQMEELLAGRCQPRLAS